MKKRISIHDIAKQLEISATTVSFVLNGKAAEKRISDAMEKKILKYVQKVGYQPNMVAKSLRTGKSNILGMIVEGISDPFFSTIARGIENKAYQLGYKIFYSSSENSTDKTKELIRTFRDRQVDGYIIAPPPGIENEIQSLLDDNLPVILFDRYLPAIQTNNIIIDNYNGSFQAIQHFLDNGYRNIGFVTIESEQTQMIDRLNGYLQTIKEKKLKKYVLKVPYNAENDMIVEKMKAFFRKYPEMNAVLLATNYLAMHGLEALSALQKKIPDDMAVIGFDDNTYFSLFSPSITAVAQPTQEISDEVIKLLMKNMSEKNRTENMETIVLPVKLNVRNSSQPKKK